MRPCCCVLARPPLQVKVLVQVGAAMHFTNVPWYALLNAHLRSVCPAAAGEGAG